MSGLVQLAPPRRSAPSIQQRQEGREDVEALVLGVDDPCSVGRGRRAVCSQSPRRDSADAVTTDKAHLGDRFWGRVRGFSGRFRRAGRLVWVVNVCHARGTRGLSLMFPCWAHWHAEFDVQRDLVAADPLYTAKNHAQAAGGRGCPGMPRRWSI